MSYEPPRNECGACSVCCTIMPVVGDMVKAAGVTCQHVCPGGGCAIYANRPEVCRGFLCMWRYDRWLGSREMYRPDRLGVMFSSRADNVLSVWEAKPGAFQDAKVLNTVAFVISKARTCHPGMVVERYPLGVLDGMRVQDLVEEERCHVLNPDTAGWYWRPYEGDPRDRIATRLPPDWKPGDQLPEDSIRERWQVDVDLAYLTPAKGD